MTWSIKHKTQFHKSHIYTPQDLNDPMIQPLFPSSQNNDHLVEKNLPVDNNTVQAQIPDKTPYIVQTSASVYQAQYENDSKISEIPHKGICEIDENTFYISNRCCGIIFPYIINFCLGFGILIFTFVEFFKNKMIYQVFIGFLTINGLFIFISLCSMISKCRRVCFIKGSNSLTIIRKVVCLKKTKTYNISELENVDFLKNGYSHNIQFLLTNGKKEIIFSTDYSCCTLYGHLYIH